jgi:hypothetical protein
MPLTLEALQFNHDPTAATHDALTIRRNATATLPTPEWRRTISILPEDSLAAYAIRDTLGNRLTIRGQFRRTDPNVTRAEVRAVAPTDLRGVTDDRLRRAALRSQSISGNVLGDVAATPITFLPSGESNFEPLELDNVPLWGAGVGVHTVTWVWQARLQPTEPWVDFAASAHRIYTLLQLPRAPWQQTPAVDTNTQLPWTEVLDYACQWAAGAQTLDDAATQVTRCAYALGPHLVEYDCPNGGATHYAWPAFNCTAFLELLRGGVGNGRYVNCSDCATVVSAFANILGCDLWQSRMGWNFALNPIRAIGSAVWQTACNWPAFSRRCGP